MNPNLVEENGIRRFSNIDIQKNVDAVLATIPDEKKGAILDVDMGPGGVRAVVAARLDDHWSIGLVGSYAHANNWGLGTRVKFVW